MKLAALALLPLLGMTAASPKSDSPVVGDYVEARTASVFAGACHYNAERVTAGKQAIAAWHFTGGRYHGIDLTGVTAAAAVASDFNLADTEARQCEIVVDSSATDAQASAVVDFLKGHDSAALGNITAVRRGLVSFRKTDDAMTVDAAGLGSMTVHPMPDRACCTQPHLVWYTPLTELTDRKVGFTETSAYTSGTISDIWSRADENSAIYGAFKVVK